METVRPTARRNSQSVTCCGRNTNSQCGRQKHSLLRKLSFRPIWSRFCVMSVTRFLSAGIAFFLQRIWYCYVRLMANSIIKTYEIKTRRQTRISISFFNRKWVLEADRVKSTRHCLLLVVSWGSCFYFWDLEVSPLPPPSQAIKSRQT
jgi:hypothetical protein